MVLFAMALILQAGGGGGDSDMVNALRSANLGTADWKKRARATRIHQLTDQQVNNRPGKE